MTTNFFHGGGFVFSLVNGIKSCHTLILFASKEENAVVTSEDFFKAVHEYRPKVGSPLNDHVFSPGRI